MNKNSAGLTPFARLMIAGMLVTAIFFALKPSKGAENNRSEVVGTVSDATTILKLSGSSTLGSVLLPEILKSFMEKELAAKDVQIVKLEETKMEVVGEMPDGKAEKMTIDLLGSQHGINDLAANNADIALFSGNTANLATDLEQTILALDGIAIVVHPSNPVKELTKAQVAGIFLQKITDWSELGGTPAPINVYGRDEHSGTTEAFCQLVFDNPDQALTPAVVKFEKATELLKTVGQEPNAIGFTSFSNTNKTKVLGLSEVGVIAHYPSVFTIQTEDYLLTRRLALVTKPSSSNPNIARLLNFCNSMDKGQAIVANSGFVNMDLSTSFNQAVVEDAPPAYITATADAKRIPTTLHFKLGSTQLDTRATEDIKRIIKILSKPENRQKKVLLIGFTDDKGNPNQNLALSNQRAQMVGTEFAKFGVLTESIGVGQALPIATNLTPAGQNKNRRVEVWLK